MHANTTRAYINSAAAVTNFCFKQLNWNAGYEGKVKIGMDVAASEFYTEDKMYDLDFKTADNDGSQKKTGAQMQDMYKSFVENYPVVSIEDPFDQVCFAN